MMKEVLNKIVDKIYKPSILFIIGSFIFVFITMDAWRNWHTDQHQFNWDVANYYAYLPAYFCNKGSFKFDSTRFESKYMPVCAYDKSYIPKTTYGMAFLYSPLFALAYKIAINQNNPLDGFSEPFATVIHWGTIIYAFIGLLLLRKFLLYYFKELIVTITLAILFLGTTLFYYSVSMPELTHSNLFALFSAFVLLNYHWHKETKYKHSFLLGLVLGLISLIRPTDIIIVLLMILWPVNHTLNFKNKFRFFVQRWRHVLLILIVAFIVWIPQFIFWKIRTGQYLFFSYPGERFYWNDPQIINVLFSYQKGLFVYTPLILLAFIGFFFMKSFSLAIRYSLLGAIFITIYIISCWWDWSFGGCFGARSFVQHFAYLSIPLASLVSFVFVNKLSLLYGRILKLLFFMVVSFGISLNLFQSLQYVNGILFPDGMTKKTYWLVFGKIKLNNNEMTEFWGSIKQIDFEKQRSGENRNQ